MKKLFNIVFFATLIFLPFSGFSQKIFPQSGGVWRVNSHGMGPLYYNQYDYFQYRETKDTLILAKKYIKIMKDRDVYDNYTYLFHDSFYVGALFNDTLNHKVYFRDIYNQEQLLYDFNQKVGDTIPRFISGNNTRPIMNSIDTIMLSDGLHKRFHFKFGVTEAYIVEGIGSSWGLIDPYYFSEGFIELICYRKNGQPIYFPLAKYSNRHTNCGSITSVHLEEKNIQYNVFPNPIEKNNKIKVEIELENMGFVNFTLYNIFGEITKDIKITSSSIEIPVEDQITGFYFYKITNGNNASTGKLVIN
jgi:hypothetical protein